MRNQQKKRVILKLWGWICLALNCLVGFLHLAEHRAEFLNLGIFLAMLTICYGVIKTNLDRLKGDTSITSIVIEYVCVYLLTYVMAFKLAEYLTSALVLISLTISSLVEMLVFMLIAYWRSIYHFFVKANKKYNTDGF